MKDKIKVIVTDIKWDFSGSDMDTQELQELKENTPTIMDMDINRDEMERLLEENLTENPEEDLLDVIDDYINDKISDISGFCHFGYSMRVPELERNNKKKNKKKKTSTTIKM